MRLPSRSSVLSSAVLVALALTAPRPASAQSQITTGVIQGAVSDLSGALVAGATIEVRNLDTNQSRSRQSDATGRFVFLLLPPGRYTVTVTLAGFATVVQEGITLTVGQTINLSPVVKPSQVAETITVTDTATVDTSKTETSTTLNEVTISTTPILGRKFQDLLTLTPGVDDLDRLRSRDGLPCCQWQCYPFPDQQRLCRAESIIRPERCQRGGCFKMCYQPGILRRKWYCSARLRMVA